jgi:hypothetical protein
MIAMICKSLFDVEILDKQPPRVLRIGLSQVEVCRPSQTAAKPKRDQSSLSNVTLESSTAGPNRTYYCLVALLPLAYLSVLYANFHSSNYLLLVYACVLPLALIWSYAARTNRARAKLVYLIGSAQVYHFLSQISLAKL